ncbi:MAG: ribonuclease R [Planctomycetota bacterium]|nr:MAG: ribonuclease R [Planctomycetota bacterium]
MLSEPNPAELERQILDYVYHPNYVPQKPKGIHRGLKLPPDLYPAIRKAIKRLVQKGQLAYASNHLVIPPEQATGDPKLTRGTFRQAAAGFGFVRPVPTGTLGAVDDIFVPAHATGSAMEGDLVEVRIKRSRRGGTEGTVVRVIERARRQFPGTFDIVNGQPVVWLDGVTVGSPVTVGDVRGLPVEKGDKVVIEMVRFPDGTSPGEGVILEVLGSSKNPAVDTLAVMRQYGLEDEFPEEVIDEARQQADAFEEGRIPEGREDLTNVPTLTIDPVDARDFDDAISLRKNEHGHWELMVHIADVGHFVRRGTALDEEAKRRATSVYLPDRVIPMLPEVISNHLASLQPNKVRLTKTVLIEMTESGMVLHHRVFNSAIHNDKRLTYEQVDQYLENPQAWKRRLTRPIWTLLGDMHTLAMTLRKNRREAGSLELFLPEIKIELDKSGKVKGAKIVEYTESHQIIEEFMLAANRAVATWLDDLEIPFLRRVHPPPDSHKLKKLTDFVRNLGIDCGNLEDRYEIQRVIDQVRGKPTEYAVNYAILKSLSKAVYQPDMEIHFALNFKHYCHFTSPIRRYPDLQVHRTVDRILHDEHPYGDPIPVLATLGHHCSDQEQKAEAAEREITKIKLLHFMNKKIGETMPAVITGVVPDGLFVRGTKIPAEGFVPIDSLPTDRYRFTRQGHVIEGFRAGNRFRLGDELTVAIEKVDLGRRTLLLRIIANHTAQREAGTSPSRERKAKPSRKKGTSKLRAKHAAVKKPAPTTGTRSPSREKKKSAAAGKSSSKQPARKKASPGKAVRKKSPRRKRSTE